MFGKRYNEPMGTTDPETIRRQSDVPCPIQLDLTHCPTCWFQNSGCCYDKKDYLTSLRLKDLDTCPNPKCGVSWLAILDSLETSPMGSEDLDQALAIIGNCDVCRIRFRREWYKIQK